MINPTTHRFLGIRFLGLGLVGVVLLSACDDFGTPPGALASFRLTPVDATVAVNNTVGFDVDGQAFGDQEVEFWVAKENVAHLGDRGRAVATALGTTIVCVEATSIPSDCTVFGEPSS